MDTLNIVVFACFMSIALVLFVLLYFLDRRSKTKGPVGDMSLFPPPGPITQQLFLVLKILLGVEFLLLVGAFVLRNMAVIWIAGGAFVILLAVSYAERLARLSGK
jgi:hypothetical protein